MELNIRDAVVGSMATFPKRFGIIQSVIEALAPQLDRLYVYVNETTEGFPDLSHLGNIIVLDGREHVGNLSANGKIYPLKYMQDCTIFTLDDDFIFPPDYVAQNLAVLRRFKGQCAVTTHGSIFPMRTDWYYERTHIFMSTNAVRSLELCTLAGSGTFAFDQRVLKVNPDDFFAEIMVDLRLSLLARDAGLPIWVLPRTAGWLHFLKTEGLWDLFSAGKLTHHTAHARPRDFSFEVYRQIALDAMSRVGLEMDDLDLSCDLRHGLHTGAVPAFWRESRISAMKRTAYMGILTGDR
jgi:hypothetical protein